VATTVLQVFSTELLAGAGRNPILAPFAIIIGLLIWFNLVSQVYLLSAAWAAVRDEDLKADPAATTNGWGRPPGAAGQHPACGKTVSGKTAASAHRPGRAQASRY
jgi:membrane protein